MELRIKSFCLFNYTCTFNPSQYKKFQCCFFDGTETTIWCLKKTFEFEFKCICIMYQGPDRWKSVFSTPIPIVFTYCFHKRCPTNSTKILTFSRLRIGKWIIKEYCILEQSQTPWIMVKCYVTENTNISPKSMNTIFHTMIQLWGRLLPASIKY